MTAAGLRPFQRRIGLVNRRIVFRTRLIVLKSASDREKIIPAPGRSRPFVVLPRPCSSFLTESGPPVASRGGAGPAGARTRRRDGNDGTVTTLSGLYPFGSRNPGALLGGSRCATGVPASRPTSRISAPKQSGGCPALPALTPPLAWSRAGRSSQGGPPGAAALGIQPLASLMQLPIALAGPDGRTYCSRNGGRPV